MKLWKTIQYTYVLTFLSGPLSNTHSYQRSLLFSYELQFSETLDWKQSL